MLRLLSLSLFLICLFSIESKGDINKTLSRISVAPTVNDTVVILNKWSEDLTEDEIGIVQLSCKGAVKESLIEGKNGTYIQKLSKGNLVIEYSFVDWDLQLFQIYVVYTEDTEFK